MLTEVSIPSVIAEGTKIQGDLIFLSLTEIFGSIEGEIAQQSLDALRIGKTGWIHGKVFSLGPILIEGRIDGDVASETRVTLSATAIVKGHISAPCIEISAGALVEGDLKMEPNAPHLSRVAA